MAYKWNDTRDKKRRSIRIRIETVDLHKATTKKVAIKKEDPLE